MIAMNYKTLPITFLTSILLSACVQVADISPKSIPKFAVVALISPTDSLMTAFLSVVNPLGQEFKAEDLKIKNAKVSISSGQNSVQLIYVDSTQRYQLTKKGFVQFDTKYDLLIEIPNQTPLKASCKTLKNLAIHFKVNLEDKKVVLETNWKDTPEEANVYSLSVSYWNAQLRRISTSGVDWDGIARSYFTISDQNLSGQEITEKGTILKSSSISDTTKFTLNFGNIDQQTTDFFDKRSSQYNQNKANQQSVFDFISNATQGQTDLSNFFERFKEPVLLPFNIENGLGFFGSYYQIRIQK
jgi:hypothetical protein